MPEWIKQKLLWLIVFSILMFILSVLILSENFISDSRFPSDDELIKNFQDNEPDFERLNQMAKEDSDFVRIADNFNWTKESAAYPRSESQKDLSEERWNEYRSLFVKLKLKDGILNYQPNIVWFTSSSKGMAAGGSSKGYVYLTGEPASVVDTLDEPNFDRPELKGKGIKTLYRKLKDNWYLFYEID